MKASDLIALFERMYAEHWAYEYGAAREGCVDCSGAFTYAFKRFGQSIEHGSNTIARKRIRGGMRPASEAKPGWAVFKWREASDDMPVQYRSDGQGDFYHIGLLAADGQNVLNAKGTKYGFCRDPLSKWAYAAPLSGVDYTDQQEEDKPMTALYQATVNTDRDPLRVRDAPGTGSNKLGSVPKGATVDVLSEEMPGWPLIRYGSLTGYASSKYLLRAVTPDNPATHPPDTDTGDTITIPREDALTLYRALSEAQRLIGAALGVD